MTNGIRNKLTPFCLKYFAGRTITKCEYQAIKLADHTHGTHYYSIHNFRARVAMVGKKDIGGSLSLEDLVGLNQKAEELKRSYIESNQLNEAANQKIRERIWSGGAALVGLLIAIVKHSSLAIGWVIVVGILILILPIFFYKPNNQGDWLIRG